MASGYATPTSYDNSISNFEDVKGLTRDRPWLLPTNRKLRHLQGISLRNLSLSKPSYRSRGKTIDDEFIPTALKSPAKLLAQRESHKLEHSKSSNNLTFPIRPNEKQRDVERTGGKGLVDSRPSIPTLRRRSTLNWSNTTPMTRQKKLEDATEGRMANTWFSVHCPDLEQPVYISEIVEKTMNPGFQFFDLSTYGPFVTRQDHLMIKFWAQPENMLEYVLLIELQVHLGSLQFIGKSLESFHHPLPGNCIIFHLSDGIYTSFTDLPLDSAIPQSATLRPKTPTIHTLPTSSFDALMRLSNLDSCIQDALATRSSLTSQINSLLSTIHPSRTTFSSLSAAHESLASTHRAIANTRRTLQTLQNRKTSLQTSLATRRTAMHTGLLSQNSSQSHLSSAYDTLSSSLALLTSTSTAITGQIRRICEDLSSIYPIEPIPNKPLSFTIRDLHLPSANFFSTTNSASETTTAAALGMVAHVIHLLSLYLSTPLPYPISPHGSTSSMTDPITVVLSHSSSSTHHHPTTSSDNLTARTFPLFQTSSLAYRFEYGVFLLNTDLECLMWKKGLRMVDQRQTLANLKYLLAVLGSGRGEMPGRKRGVIGGLIGDADVDAAGRRDSDSYDSADTPAPEPPRTHLSHITTNTTETPPTIAQRPRPEPEPEPETTTATISEVNRSSSSKKGKGKGKGKEKQQVPSQYRGSENGNGHGNGIGNGNDSTY